MANNSQNDSCSGPLSGQWYNLKLGSSFRDETSNKYFSLRYEFKPASIDKTKPGSLHKNKENRVSVEFHNNQPGKPKVTFEGSMEECKENDAVLFFDGTSFRLERLHRAVKQLRHIRRHGDTASSLPSTAPAQHAPPDRRSSPAQKRGRHTSNNRNMTSTVPVEVETIDVGVVVPQVPAPEVGATTLGKAEHLHPEPDANALPLAPMNQTPINREISMEDIFGADLPSGDDSFEEKIDNDIGPNPLTQNDEMGDVDISSVEADKGLNAAEALRAQMIGEEGSRQSSSSSSSGSSGSSSGNSDTDGSDDEDSIISI